MNLCKLSFCGECKCKHLLDFNFLQKVLKYLVYLCKKYSNTGYIYAKSTRKLGIFMQKVFKYWVYLCKKYSNPCLPLFFKYNIKTINILVVDVG